MLCAGTKKDCQSDGVPENELISFGAAKVPSIFGNMLQKWKEMRRLVQRVALAGKSKKAYISTPLKRWNDIGA